MGVLGQKEMKRAVFLDRDGVLNEVNVVNGKSHPPDTLQEFKVIVGVPRALAALDAAGFALIVITNQPDVANGIQKKEVVQAMNARLLNTLPLDAVKVCYHNDSANCLCRKPKPGMLLEAAEEFKIDLPRSYVVGDRWRDIEAGEAVGCKTLFIDYNYAEKRPNPTWTVSSLLEASQIILNAEGDRR
jgi:D-glycero-D-manno-heptose 1,7-bisphosphate phosphatase